MIQHENEINENSSIENQLNTLEFHIPSSTIASHEVSRDAAKYRPDRPPGP